MTLTNKTILITRSAQQAQEFAQEIERRGGAPVLFPTIEIVPPASWGDCDTSLEKLYMYDGLIFTSVNGAEYFFRRMAERKVATGGLDSKMILVVGEKTRHAVEHYGFNVTLMPEQFSAADLSGRLAMEDLRGKTFLFPRGNLGRNILQDTLKLLGAAVDPVTVYQTVKPQQDVVDEILASLMDGKIDVVTFTSPSTFNNFASLCPKQHLIEICERTKIAVIGPTTAAAVHAAGFEPDIVAKHATVESLVEGIVAFFESGIRTSNSELIS